MRSAATLAALALIVPAAAFAQTGNARHAYVKRNGVSRQYAGKHNPLRPSALNLEAGRKLYEKKCAVCHGASGLGSEAGLKLDPPVPSLFGLRRKPIASDAFYDWTIAEGGAPVASAMPPFKHTLKPEQIWQIVLFLRTL